MKALIIVSLLLLVAFSGCVMETGLVDTTGDETALEDQAADLIEQELEDAVENIDISDIESEIAE